jgi:hypothetical protein
MNKKMMVILMILIIISAFSYAVVLEVENETEKFVVTMISQEPDTVAPGEIVDVRFRLENRRTETAKNVEVRFEEKHPFILYGDSEIKEIGTIAVGQIDETGVMVKYTLKVDPGAAEGENAINFYYRKEGGPWIKGGDFSIEVGERDAVLAINEITSQPERLVPGTLATVKFRLDNLAGSVLKDIKLKLDVLESITLTTAVQKTELPFTPIGSGNEKTVDKIYPKKSADVLFSLFVDADAESKAYKVPYILTYFDAAGNDFTRTGYLGLMVDAEPDVSMNIDETDIYSAGSKGTINLRFVNKGFGDVKFLDVVLKETDQFDIVSNPEVYIGNIDSDDYETADYTIIVKKGAQSPVKLPLSVEYRDANGRLYPVDKVLELELFEGAELKQRTNGEGNSAVGIIVVIIIVVVGVVIWRWRKKRRNK